MDKSRKQLINKFDYQLTLSDINNAKYKKDLEAIARKLYQLTNKFANSYYVYYQNNATSQRYNLEFPLSEVILVSKLFFLVMGKCTAKQVKLPDYITSKYERLVDLLPIYLFNQTLRTILL